MSSYPSRPGRQPGTRLQSILTLLLATTFLWGCGSSPKKEDPVVVEEPPEEVQPIPVKDLSATLPPSRYSELFLSAEQSLAGFDWMQAAVTLNELPPNLSADDGAYKAYLEARIAYIRGQQSDALSQLDRVALYNLHPALQYRLLSFKHYVLEMQGDAISSAQLADQILGLAPRDTTAAWKRNVWLNLERCNIDQLITAQATAIDPRWRGWLDLALISRESVYSPSAALTAWRDGHPDHPAANPLPGGLDFQLVNAGMPDKIAVMLPLSGKLAPAGQAVLNGFLAAYYAHNGEGGATDELTVIDVNQFASASAAYDEAISRGATLAVGPLTKESVADLATRLERPIPILALNRIDTVLPAAGSAMVQLSLSPADEAVSVADLAFGTGARRALVLTADGDWGSRMESAIKEHWTKLGGTVVSSASFSSYEDYSGSVMSALSLEASEQRAKDLQGLLGREIEFTPRRRQDVDVVFLLTNRSAEARSIKPLLAFHYAGDLPIFTLSNIYNGIPDERDKDLNGIYLVETPWLLGANPGLRVTLAAGDLGANYTRLNALGADAYLVQSGFARLQSGADAVFRGNTGLLTMDPGLILHRELLLATFDRGVLKTP